MTLFSHPTPLSFETYLILKNLYMILDEKFLEITGLFLTLLLEVDLINNKVHRMKTQISQLICACLSSGGHRVAGESLLCKVGLPQNPPPKN